MTLVRKEADNCPESHRDLGLQSLEKKTTGGISAGKRHKEKCSLPAQRGNKMSSASQCSWSHLHLLCALLKELTPQPVH